MPVLEYKLDYSAERTVLCPETAAAIIVAAGSSERMGGKPKQLMLLAGVPVIARTLQKFEMNRCISKIIVVAREKDITEIQKISHDYLITKLTDIVVGGSTRAESVKNGLKVLSEKDKYVLIHDGARPLVSSRLISDSVNAAVKFGAAGCAVKVKDTVKLVDENGIIKKTIDRSQLVLMQTPQVFLKEKYFCAVESLDTIDKFTDDCAIMESAGYQVRIVEGDYKNIKITTPEDIITAEGFIKAGEDE